ncbi:hypothetical protein KC131_22915 [Pseudomonas sp. JQ170]|jgi:hypothetical protein|nr:MULTISPECIES: hypothetical protein [unclassified Pseudomonas]MDN7143507.1 hypothetical protein [Pseudomonas sp. JQ170]WRO73854.1 hypothetical protein U9R80_15075 [Pseudomonas sp. 170C]
MRHYLFSLVVIVLVGAATASTAPDPVPQHFSITSLYLPKVTEHATFNRF